MEVPGRPFCRVAAPLRAVSLLSTHQGKVSPKVLTVEVSGAALLPSKLLVTPWRAMSLLPTRTGQGASEGAPCGSSGVALLPGGGASAGNGLLCIPKSKMPPEALSLVGVR